MMLREENVTFFFVFVCSTIVESFCHFHAWLLWKCISISYNLHVSTQSSRHFSDGEQKRPYNDMARKQNVYIFCIFHMFFLQSIGSITIVTFTKHVISMTIWFVASSIRIAKTIISPDKL